LWVCLDWGVSRWVEKEFQSVDFSSKRLKKRFLKVKSDLAQEPEKSIWLASGSRTNTKAAYRMIGNQEFTKENILTVHHDATNTRNQNTNTNKGNNVLLAVQDTMAVNYDTHKKMIGLGYNCDKTLGINVHSCLLITPGGVTTGLVDQSIIPGKQIAIHVTPMKNKNAKFKIKKAAAGYKLCKPHKTTPQRAQS
jgi:hypothetical protein